MNHDADELRKKLEAFQQSHNKEALPEYRKYIISLYKELIERFDENTKFSVEYYETGLTVTITAKNIVSTEDFHVLQEMIHKATSFDASVNDGKVVLTLVFSFCAWADKE